MTIHQATLSKSLVNVLIHNAGHCISFEQLRQLDTSLAEREIFNFETHGLLQVPHIFFVKTILFSLMLII